MFIFAISWTAVGRLLPFRKRISWLSFSTPAARWSLTLRRWDFDVTTLDRSDPAALRESCLFALVRGSRFKLEKFQEKRFGILKMTLCVVSFFFFLIFTRCMDRVFRKCITHLILDKVDFIIKKCFLSKTLVVKLFDTALLFYIV